ncbi:hypothetical protein AC1031_010600 [Aphanomyces cochlioides]|nr:hypothetical protein AC1031_010600 [Aphanomyces cochlioides]
MSDNNFSDVPTELVDWDPQIISLNTNGFSNSHRYILDKLSSVHDVSFIQETRFRTPSLHDRVAFHWQRITNHEGSLFFEEPIYPEVSTSPATGGLATLIHPHSPLKNATQVPHDNPVLRGRYLQVRCTLGPLTVVLHNIYAPAAFQERASYFEELPRDFPPHALHIVGGDFNCTLNKDLDSLRPSTSTMAGTLQLEQWMHSLSLVDLFRRQNPVARAFTSPTLTNRLDYIFCSSTLAGLRHWKATHMPHVPQADHVACRIITKRQTLRHGSGSWKAPTWLLRLPRAAEIVHGCLDRFLDKSPTFHNISKAYDLLVNDIRSQLKEFDFRICLVLRTSPAKPEPVISISTIMGKGSKWMSSEDNQLARSWVCTSEDSTKGDDQTSDSFWSSIHAHWVASGCGEARSVQAVKNRWAILNRAVQEFAGYVAQVNSRHESGKTAEDSMQGALALYLQLEHEVFQHEAVWRTLSFSPKWQFALAEKEHQHDRVPGENNQEDVEPELPRPIGTKQAKRKSSESSTTDKALKALVQAQEEKNRLFGDYMLLQMMLKTNDTNDEPIFKQLKDDYMAKRSRKDD